MEKRQGKEDLDKVFEKAHQEVMAEEENEGPGYDPSVLLKKTPELMEALKITANDQGIEHILKGKDQGWPFGMTSSDEHQRYLMALERLNDIIDGNSSKAQIQIQKIVSYRSKCLL